MKHLILLSVALGTLGIGCQGEVAIGADEPGALAPMHSPTPTQTPDPQTDPTPLPEQPETPTTPENTAPLRVEPPELSPEDATFYMRSLVQMLVGRPLESAEVNALQTQGSAAIRPMLEAWTKEPGFARSARYLMAQKLKASGERDGVDFEAPGRLVEYVVNSGLPFSTIITADYCIAADGTQTTCDSGAPYNAGVLTTRAFLAGNAGRFNLGRATRLMKVFACRAYPMESDLQPYLEKEVLIPMFRASTAEEQTVEEAKDAFGNGSACYSCHGQFGAHAQFFVKFDQTGLWRAEATGLQDPEGELGRSFDGLMTSHMDDDSAAAFEGSKMFGQDVPDIRGAAQVLSESDVFVPCMARNVIEYTFGMTDTAAGKIARDMLEQVAWRATKGQTQDPTWADIVVETFVEPRVIQVVLSSQGDVQ